MSEGLSAIVGGGISSLALILMLIIGIVLIIILVKVILFLIIPGIMALVVWYITGDTVLTGITFLIVAVLTIIFRR
ncbi:MAG: hypothetical protein GX369_06280 [Euryarchaeota archaeon]|nr:hypothetical protein [Euryarchaeota archaeon]